MKNKYSLFIGRYQPLHSGHVKLMKTVLKEGKNICIALRDTEIDEKNPYNIEQRMKMCYDAFEEYRGRVKVIVIPDIEDVVYGRKVGWGIRQIKLDKKTESISATKIRKEAVSDYNIKHTEGGL